MHLQANLSRFSLVVNYTLSSAETWGCVLGELFDYVNGVCNPLNAFAKGDYGPSGENVTDRLVLAGTVHLPGGFEFSVLSQAESARPFTLTTPVDVNGFGDPLDDRAIVNGVQTGMDQFRGTPYIQTDMRVSRPFRFRERWQVMPFIEIFNLFNRNNPGANYVTNLAALPVPVNNLVQCHGVLPERGLHLDAAHHQPESVARARRRAGRFLRSRHHGGHPVCGAVGNPAKLLTEETRISSQSVGLCAACAHAQIDPLGPGLVFSIFASFRPRDPRFPKYPRLPVLSCEGYTAVPEAPAP